MNRPVKGKYLFGRTAGRIAIGVGIAALALPLYWVLAASLESHTYLPMIYSAPLYTQTPTPTVTQPATPSPTPTSSPTPTPTTVPTPEIIPNGDFEQGPVIWTQYSQNGWPLIVQEFPGGIYPYDGTWAAWMGGDNNELALLQQQVVVPSSLPYLSYWFWISSVDVCGADFAHIFVNGIEVTNYDLCYTTGGWAFNVIDLSAFTDEPVLLQIYVECNYQWASSLFLDHFAFQSGLRASGYPARERVIPEPYILKQDILDK
jgi:hypothetical protein